MAKGYVYRLSHDPGVRNHFRTAVSLHGHTLHSKESVRFFRRLTDKSLGFSLLVHYHFRSRSSLRSLDDELARIWWTCPLSAGQAFRLESSQIEETLQLHSLVSITDHDNIDGPLQLQLVAGNERAPISVEWTVPYKDTRFHLGIHNLPQKSAQEVFRRMENYKRRPEHWELRGLMADLARLPEVLIVFNHPIWDQTPLRTRRDHLIRMREFLADFGDDIHALELNGMRSWRENLQVLELSWVTGCPVISGGDRHGCEPNAMVNLTNASTFSEFVSEVRDDRRSEVLILPPYEEPLTVRVTQTIRDNLSDYPEHAFGWTKWSDRVFRLGDEGQVQSFGELCGDREPLVIRHSVRLASLLTNRRLRPALRLALAERSEAAP